MDTSKLSIAQLRQQLNIARQEREHFAYAVERPIPRLRQHQIQMRLPIDICRPQR